MNAMEQNQDLITSVPEGKRLDFLTKRFVNDTPEEYVRQNIEKALIRQYKYAVEDCRPEVSIKVGSVLFCDFLTGVAQIINRKRDIVCSLW